MSEAGNETTWARDRGLRAVAEQRYTDPMNTWPPHEPRHERTIMGARLVDSECLRCHLESVAIAAAKRFKAECDACPDCGPLSMCAKHSRMSEKTNGR